MSPEKTEISMIRPIDEKMIPRLHDRFQTLYEGQRTQFSDAELETLKRVLKQYDCDSQKGSETSIKTFDNIGEQHLCRDDHGKLIDYGTGQIRIILTSACDGLTWHMEIFQRDIEEWDESIPIGFCPNCGMNLESQLEKKENSKDTFEDNSFYPGLDIYSKPKTASFTYAIHWDEKLTKSPCFFSKDHSIANIFIQVKGIPNPNGFGDETRYYVCKDCLPDATIQVKIDGVIRKEVS